ncbi:MAG: hypothetical protein ABSH22_02620 [Tepidisphaeraceae bacterium]
MRMPDQVKVRGAAEVDSPPRPAWLEESIRRCEGRWIEGSTGGLKLCVFESTGHRVIRARIENADALNDDEFQAATIAAYGDIARELRAAPAHHVVRMWNYIPDIHRPCQNGLDRYMVFNAGRFKACQAWLGNNGNGGFEEQLPTASGVGHAGDDLVIDALGMPFKGLAVENPRQTPAYQYSAHYGPRPPCFARAMITPPFGSRPARLLVGGTASVRGEQSVHAADLAAQIKETLENLASLLRAALRVYHPRIGDGAAILRSLRQRFAKRTRIEFMTATLCRKELLVEIEGVASGGRKA